MVSRNHDYSSTTSTPSSAPSSLTRSVTDIGRQQTAQSTVNCALPSLASTASEKVSPQWGHSMVIEPFIWNGSLPLLPAPKSMPASRPEQDCAGGQSRLAALPQFLAMKPRRLASICSFTFALTLADLPAAAPQTAGQAPGDRPAPTVQATTVKRSALKVGHSSFALVKGTKLEVISREGDMLLVKYHSSQGMIPVADTDFVPTDKDAPDEQSSETQPATPAPAKPAAATNPAALPAVPRHSPDGGQDKSRADSSQQRETAGQTPGGPQPSTVPHPPALAVDGKPTSNYGKMVQKAKQAAQAHDDKTVKPADEVTDEKPKK